MTEPEETPTLSGTLTWSDSKDISINVKLDKVAIHKNKLMFVAIVGVDQNLKAMRAAFAAGINNPIRLDNVVLHRNGVRVSPGLNITCMKDGYRAESHRLGLDQHHAIFTARRPGLMLVDTDAALWAELKAERYSTPLLRGWLPYLRTELTDRELLEPCETLGCNCCMLVATPEELDKVVEHGLKNDKIEIREEYAA